MRNLFIGAFARLLPGISLVVSLLLAVVQPLVGTVSAQPSEQAAPWHVAIYDQSNDQGQILIVTAQGITQRLPVPVRMLPPAQGGLSIGEVVVSADNHYLALTYYDTTGSATSAQPVAIADLATGTCCVYV